MLTGCAGRQVWETVNDPWVEVAAPCREVKLKLPAEAMTPVLQNPGAGQLYLCDGYTLAVQTLNGGDLDATMRQITGFSLDALTCIQTACGEYEKYECVWSAAGEGSDQVGRAVVLDDGHYHYAVSVMADHVTAGTLTQAWQKLLGSVSLADIG